MLNANANCYLFAEQMFLMRSTNVFGAHYKCVWFAVQMFWRSTMIRFGPVWSVEKYNLSSDVSKLYKCYLLLRKDLFTAHNFILYCQHVTAHLLSSLLLI